MINARFYIVIILLVMSAAVVVFAAETEAEDESHMCEKVIFKKIGDVELRLHVFKPAPDDAGASKPPAGIVCFYGGGWRTGDPRQFYPHCRYLAGRGMVAIAAEYRIKSLHGTPVSACVEDGKSAVRWIRQHAAQLGLDPNRLAAAGGSAGGHVALCAALIEGFEAEGEDLSVSSVPDALVLFNPAVDATGKLAALFDGREQELSPIHHIKKGIGPSLVFHGTADKIVPVEDVRRFAKLMTDAANRCELVEFEGMEHAFFNFGRHGSKPYEQTVRLMDDFLCSLGYLNKPTLHKNAPEK